MTRAVFLDRDGTLNAEVGFVTEPDRLLVLPGAIDAVRRLDDAGLLPVVVTNQSGIARGRYGEHDLARIHERLQQQLGGRCAAFLHCPHHPGEGGPWGGACSCRKPGAGLLHQARELLGVSFAGSYLVGDSARDVQMAQGLPIQALLVRSGKPVAAERARLLAAGCEPAAEVDDLAAAADWILARERGR